MNEEQKQVMNILKTAYDLYDIELTYKQVTALYDYITDLVNTIKFLRSHQKLDESFFKWHLEDLEEELEKLKITKQKTIELLLKYNDKESNYWVPVQEALDILGGDDNDI